MPLSKIDLKDKLSALFDSITSGTLSIPHVPHTPMLPAKMASSFAETYDKWITESSPLAGSLTISSKNTSKGLLQTSLSSTPGVPPLFGFAGWVPGIAAYWTPVVFSGLGFIPVNPISPPSILVVSAGLLLDFTAMFVKGMLPGGGPKSNDETADRIATILHKWTKKIEVIATTTSAPPVVSTLPIV